MANASKKKANQAKKEAASLYKVSAAALSMKNVQMIDRIYSLTAPILNCPVFCCRFAITLNLKASYTGIECSLRSYQRNRNILR